MFADLELIEFNYNSYLLTNNIEKTEFVCSSHRSSYDLKLRLPFSWIIKRSMDRLIDSKTRNVNEHAVSTSREQEDVHEQLANAFQMSRLNESLAKYASTDEFINSYLSDYLLLSGPAVLGESHLKTLVKRIREFSRTMFKRVDLVSVTYSWTLLKNELILFSRFVQFDLKVIISFI